MRLNGVEALRKAEKEAAEHRHRVEKLRATKERVERRMKAEKDLKWEIERLEIEKSAMPERANEGAFRGKVKGEVLFCGAAGSKRGQEDWEVTFKWAASPNKTDIQIGDITVPSKEGWH